MKENNDNLNNITDNNSDYFDFNSLADSLAKEVNSDFEEKSRLNDTIIESDKGDVQIEDESKEFDLEDSSNDDYFLDLDGIFDEEEDEEDEEVDTDPDNELVDVDEDEEDEDYDEDEVDKKKMPKWLKYGLIAFLSTCIVAPIIVFLWVWLGVYNDFSDQKEQDEQFDFKQSANPDDVVVDYDDIDWSNAISGSTRYDENVINILLLGEDGHSGQESRERSDTMIIVTINKNEKTVKMTSIMRDIFVKIPDHSDNKINSAYQTGGVDLIKKTIEENFKVAIDYTVIVQFDTFKAIIDELGGIDVEINEEEAAFINEKCESSGVVLPAGKVHLDGRHCLWFARIRKIDSDIYGNDDFGRTARQRTVLSQVFKKYKDLSYTQIASLAEACIPYIETDLDPKTIVKCIALVLSYKLDEIESLRIPMDGKYEFASVYYEPSNQYLDVIMINKFMEENIDAMHMFIYGDLLY